MNKIFLAILCGLLLTVMSCEEEPTQLELDIQAIDNYLAANNIDAFEHSSGLRYKIINGGTGDFPTLSSQVEVHYEGRLMSNESVFDKTGSGPRTFTLYTLIEGWKIGLPFIREGGEIILYIPSSLGYGAQGSGSVPPNENLIFTIELVSVQ